MPLIILLRSLFGLLSLLLVAACAYLLWTWYDGALIDDGAGIVRVREDWRLWVAIGLAAWSLLGKALVIWLLAKRDEAPTRAIRARGRQVQGGSGATLYVERHGGDGPPLIFIHGWGMDSTIWCYAKRDLSREFQVITWDLPGLGLSTPAAGGGGISLTDFAADLRALIHDVGRGGSRPVVLVGHSIGGMTIQTLARDYPEMLGQEVAGVVLLNTTHTNPLKTMVASHLALALRWPVIEPMMRLAIWLQPVAWLFAWQGYLSGSAHMANRFGFGRYVTRSQLEHTTLLATRNPPGAQAKGILSMLRWDATEALANIRCPALVIGGDMDLVTKLEASRTIAAATPGAELEVVSGVNHMGFLERADIYNAAIAAFARRAQPDRERVLREAAAPAFH